MNEDEEDEMARTNNDPYQVRLPGFVSDEDLGLGDVVKHITYAFGITPCGGCERRAAVLNRAIVFTGRNK